MNSDHLQQAAIAFQKLLPVEYRIVLGKKGQSFELHITFQADNFFHLTGLHKITSSHMLKLPKAKIFDSILSGKISDSTVNNFASAPDILERIKVLTKLETLLDEEQTAFFKYDATKVAFSKISANYLAKGIINDTQIVFSFFVKQSSNEAGQVNCYVNSIFPLTKYDFSERQTKYTVLLKEKIDADGAILLYRHKNFNEQI